MKDAQRVFAMIVEGWSYAPDDLRVTGQKELLSGNRCLRARFDCETLTLIR